MNLIGGPLDGTKYDGKVSTDNPFIILECTKGCGQVDLYACYKLEDEKLIFVSTKTKNQLLVLALENEHRIS